MNSKICYFHLWFWHCAANVIFSNQPVIENISSHVFTSISMSVCFKARPIHRFTYRNTRRITLKARAYLLGSDTITILNHEKSNGNRGSIQYKIWNRMILIWCNSNIQKQSPQACNLIKKETLTQVFSCEFCEISNNIF